MNYIYLIWINIIILFYNLDYAYLDLSFTYPSAVTLENGNILVVEKYGIYICDSILENIINNPVNFTEEDQLKDENEISKVEIKDKIGYIACFVKFKLYLFSRDGDLKKSINYKLIFGGEEPIYFSFIPIFNKNNCYYYVFTYFNSNSALTLIYYKMDLTDNYKNSIINILGFTKFRGRTGIAYKYPYLHQGISCEYMTEYENPEKNFLVCFLMISNSNKATLAQDYYSISESEIEDENTHGSVDLYLNDVSYIKTLLNNNRDKVLLFIFVENNDLYKILIYQYYYTESFLLSGGHLEDIYDTDYICAKKFYGIKTNFIYETSKLSLSFITYLGAMIQSILFNDDLQIYQTKSQFSTCESIYGHSVIYSDYYYKYYVVSDVICSNHKRTFIDLYGSIPIITDNDRIEEEEELVLIEENELVKEKFEENLEYEKFKEIEYLLFDEIHEFKEYFEIEIFKEKESIEEKIIKENEIFEEENYIEINQINEIEEIEIEKNEEIYEEKIKEIETDKKFECPELEKCSECDTESILLNLCIKCNNEKNYYLLKNKLYSNSNTKYIECVNEHTKPKKYYLNSENKIYEHCYETCEECNSKGNSEDNKCTLCDNLIYIFEPDKENSMNCVPKCPYLYYYTNEEEYKCTESSFCPDDYNILINSKNKCTNDCSKEKIFKYSYNRECFIKCPNNTINEENNFICKDSDLNKCTLSENNLIIKDEDINDIYIEKLAKIYVDEFKYTNVHVSVYKNNIYSITIYKDINCINDLNLELPEINFGECEIKVKSYYNISENIVVVIIDKKIENRNVRKMILYRLFSPYNGELLKSDDICENDKLTISESLIFKLQNTHIDLVTFKEFASKGIEIWDLDSPFYNDVCFEYILDDVTDTIIKYKDKDIALKDRALVYFPNISLCENDCNLKGINITTFRAICECSYSNNNLLKNNAIYKNEIGQIEELLNSINIYVIKCIKNVINSTNIKRCIGGLIIFIILILEIICTIFFRFKGIIQIKLYIYQISQNL